MGPPERFEACAVAADPAPASVACPMHTAVPSRHRRATAARSAVCVNDAALPLRVHGSVSPWFACGRLAGVARQNGRSRRSASVHRPRDLVVAPSRFGRQRRKDFQGAQPAPKKFFAIIHTALGVLGAWLHHATAWHALAARPLFLFSADSARAAKYFFCAEARGEPRAGEQQQRRKQQQ